MLFYSSPNVFQLHLCAGSSSSGPTQQRPWLTFSSGIFPSEISLCPQEKLGNQGLERSDGRSKGTHSAGRWQSHHYALHFTDEKAESPLFHLTANFHRYRAEFQGTPLYSTPHALPSLSSRAKFEYLLRQGACSHLHCPPTHSLSPLSSGALGLADLLFCLLRLLSGSPWAGDSAAMSRGFTGSYLSFSGSGTTPDAGCTERSRTSARRRAHAPPSRGHNELTGNGPAQWGSSVTGCSCFPGSESLSGGRGERVS